MILARRVYNTFFQVFREGLGGFRKCLARLSHSNYTIDGYLETYKSWFYRNGYVEKLKSETL